MTAKVIAVLHEKGGVGKTTAAMTLAAGIAERGLSVMVADCDPQGSAVAWASSASPDKPFPAEVLNFSGFGERLHQEIYPHINSYDVILLDCPPSVHSLSNHSALLISDLVIIPVCPTPTDFWSLHGLKSLIVGAQAVNQTMRTVLLPTRVMRTSLSNSILNNLGHFEIPMMNTRLTSRVAYQEAAISGCSVASLGHPAKVAAMEVTSLCDEVMDLLVGGVTS